MRAFFSLALPVCLLVGCAPIPTGPQSKEDAKPWSIPQQGEGQGAFGGALQKR